MISFIYLLTGAAAGLLAGLLGIGGGIIVVPILDRIFAYQQFPDEIGMHMAIGTSLAIMMFTSLSSSIAYFRRDLIVWPMFYRFTPGLLAGTLSGVWIAKQIPSHHLRSAFAIFLILIALHLFFQYESSRRLKEQDPRSWVLFSVSFCIGLLSAFFGIGGGMIMVPFFLYCKIPTLKSIGTSAICSVPLALVGTFSYTFIDSIKGWHETPWLIGYIYWPAVMLVVITSVFFAPIGAWLATRLPSATLKRIFAIILLITSVNLLMK